MTDGDGDERAALRAGNGVVGLGHRTQERKRLEIDADDLEAGLPAGVHVAVDELAVRDDQKHAGHLLALVVHRLREHLVVEHRLLERNRQHLLSAEADRVRKLLRIVDAGDLEGAHADAVVRDAEAHAALRKLVDAEELPQSDGESLGVAQLATDDDTVLQRRADRLHELGRAPLLTRAAAICEPPILSPTSFFELMPGSDGSDGAGGAPEARSFGIEIDSDLDFVFGFGSDAGSAASHSLAPRLSENSRL